MIKQKKILNKSKEEYKKKSKIPKGQTEIVKSQDRQDHGQQNETADKQSTHNTTLNTLAILLF